MISLLFGERKRSHATLQARGLSFPISALPESKRERNKDGTGEDSISLLPELAESLTERFPLAGPRQIAEYREIISYFSAREYRADHERTYVF